MSTERHIVTVEQPSQDWQDDFERRVAIVIAAAVKEHASPRHVADGLKLALEELASSEPETLRKFLMAVFDHLGDGASKWAGKKLLTMVAAAMFSAGVWLITRKW